MIVLLFIMSLLCKSTKIIDTYSINDLLKIKQIYKKAVIYTNIDVISEHIINRVITLQENNVKKYKYVFNIDNKYIVNSVVKILNKELPFYKKEYNNEKNEISIDLY